MLDRIIAEIVAAAARGPSSSGVDLPITPSKRTGTMRKKDISREPAVALRQLTTRAFASLFAEIMIKAAVPAKEKDKAVLEERKVRFVELFLSKDAET